MTGTEDRICEALLDLMEEQPLRTIKVTKLAERAGVSRSTFYMYFDSLDDVVARLEDKFFQIMPEIEDVPDPYRISEDQARAYIATLGRQLRTFQLFTGPNGDPAFEARLEERDRRSLEATSSQRYKDAHAAELDAVHEFIHGGKMRVARWWAVHHDDISLRDFSAVILRLVQACVRVTKTR